jgi:hypothetical protein
MRYVDAELSPVSPDARHGICKDVPPYMAPNMKTKAIHSYSSLVKICSTASLDSGDYALITGELRGWRERLTQTNDMCFLQHILLRCLTRSEREK